MSEALLWIKIQKGKIREDFIGLNISPCAGIKTKIR